jgi:ketosteroid isomerase-like protein
MRPSRMLSALRVAMAGGLLACSSENAGSPPPAPIDWHSFDVPHGAAAVPPGPTPRERAVAEAYVGILGSPDLGTLQAHLAGDVHFAFPGLPEGRGKDSVVRSHETLFGAFDQRTMRIMRLWRTDSVQALEWTLTGVQAREWMGAPPTGKPVAFKGLTVLFTQDDGTISDVHIYFDVAVVKTQLGVGPKGLVAPPPAASSSGPPEELGQNHGLDEANNVLVARATIDALEKNDEAAYGATMTDDVVLETLDRAQPMRGREEERAWFRAMHRAIGLLDTTLGGAWGVTRYAVAEYFIAGEQTGPLGWVPMQKDKVVRLQVADVMEIRDGKVDHIWRYDNLAQIAPGAGP